MKHHRHRISIEISFFLNRYKINRKFYIFLTTTIIDTSFHSKSIQISSSYSLPLQNNINKTLCIQHLSKYSENLIDNSISHQLVFSFLSYRVIWSYWYVALLKLARVVNDKNLIIFIKLKWWKWKHGKSVNNTCCYSKIVAGNEY